MKCSNERKQAVLAKLCPPHTRWIREVAAEEGISEATLYSWRNQARERGELYPDAGSLCITIQPNSTPSFLSVTFRALME